MLKKRLVGVITVRDGRAVQSFGYRRYLPIGDPRVCVENLDRWGADEVLLQSIDRSRRGLGPDFRSIERVSLARVGVPLLYGGGIRTLADGVQAVQAGADRIVLDAMLWENPALVIKLAETLGSQAIVACIPAIYTPGGFHWVNYRRAATMPLSTEVAHLIESGVVSETLLVDCRNEGAAGAFDMRLLQEFPVKATPLIAFGGISERDQLLGLFGTPRVVAVGIGNFLNYREHALQKIRECLPEMPLRSSIYDSKYSYLAHV